MSLGSLTTVFSPAPTCVSPDHFWVDERGNGDICVQQGPPYTQAPECFPSGFIPVSSSYYSPGVCPSSYTPACSSTLVEDGKKVTAQVCCPSFGKYTCPPDGATEYNRLPWFTTFGCWSEISSTITVNVTIAKPKSNIVTTSSFWAGIFGAYAVNVRLAEGQTTFPTETGTASNRAPTLIATTGQVSNSPTETAPSTESSSTAQGATGSAISSGVAAGIGVGAGLGIFLMALGLAFVVRRSRTTKRELHAGEDSSEPSPSLGWHSLPLNKRQELQGSELPVAELAGSHGHNTTNYTPTDVVSPESPDARYTNRQGVHDPSY